MLRPYRLAASFAVAAMLLAPHATAQLKTQRTGFDVALVERVWQHHRYPGALVPDLLDVMVEEDPFVAVERDRMPRSRAELAVMIDASVLRVALE